MKNLESSDLTREHKRLIQGRDAKKEACVRCIAKDNLIILSDRVDMGDLRKESGGRRVQILPAQTDCEGKVGFKPRRRRERRWRILGRG